MKRHLLIDMCVKINEMNEIDQGISFTTRIISNDLIESYTRMPDSRKLNFMKEKNVQR